MVKLVIFDAEGILHDSMLASKHFRARMEKLMRDHGGRPDSSNMWADLSLLVGKGKISMREGHKIYLARRGLPGKYLDEYEKIDMESMKKIRLTEKSVRSTLLKLKRRKYKIAVLSDTGHNSAVKRSILKHLGINIFDAVFVSSALGHMKPDKEAYEAVLNHFHVRAKDAVFVGHETEELDGAKSLGIKTISYRGDPADYNIRNFSEIVNIVEKL